MWCAQNVASSTMRILVCFLLLSIFPPSNFIIIIIIIIIIISSRDETSLCQGRKEDYRNEVLHGFHVSKRSDMQRTFVHPGGVSLETTKSIFLSKFDRQLDDKDERWGVPNAHQLMEEEKTELQRRHL